MKVPIDGEIMVQFKSRRPRDGSRPHFCSAANMCLVSKASMSLSSVRSVGDRVDKVVRERIRERRLSWKHALPRMVKYRWHSLVSWLKRRRWGDGEGCRGGN